MDGVEFLLKLRLDVNEPSRRPGLLHPDNAFTSHGSRWPWRYSFNELLRRRGLFGSTEISNPYSSLEVKLGDFLDAQINHQELQSSVGFQQLLDLLEHAESETRLTTRNVTGYFFCLMTILMRHIALYHFPKRPEPASYLTVNSGQRQAGLKQLARLSRLLERVSIMGFEVTAHSEYLFLIAFHELLAVVLYFESKLGRDNDSLVSLRFHFEARMRLWQVIKLIFDNIKSRGPWIGWKPSDLLRRLSLALTIERRMGVLPYFESIGQSQRSDKMLLEFLHFATDDKFDWLLECLLARSIGFDWNQIATITVGLVRSDLGTQAIGNEMNPTASKALKALGCNQTDAQVLARSFIVASSVRRDPVISEPPGETINMLKRRDAFRLPRGRGDSGT
ncbi:hypothetical protein CMUS01_09620 [Colletotrichum musicola]|uniref:Uncharacterized protein n=1 Tax=Colletotrichum musicola TaxID=2175873 RepID=A0A8H6K766_9PEZI|nr:hypothetical protein CMUS01_09620 [Colletotrichum musicola]